LREPEETLGRRVGGKQDFLPSAIQGRIVRDGDGVAISGETEALADLSGGERDPSQRNAIVAAQKVQEIPFTRPPRDCTNRQHCGRCPGGDEADLGNAGAVQIPIPVARIEKRTNLASATNV